MCGFVLLMDDPSSTIVGFFCAFFFLPKRAVSDLDRFEVETAQDMRRPGILCYSRADFSILLLVLERRRSVGRRKMK